MNFTRSSQVAHPLHTVAKSITAALNERGAELKNASLTDTVLSMESLTDERQYNEFLSNAKQLKADLVDFYQKANIDISAESFTESQWQSGVVALMAAGRPGEYAKRALTMGRAVGGQDVFLRDVPAGAYGDFDYRDTATASLEAFDDRELIANLPFSVVFNIQAARQNEFGESFYPTVVVTPDQGSVDVSVRRTMVFNEVRHEITGKPFDFHRRNLIEAVIDHTLLTDNSTAAIPVWVAGNAANNANFNTDIPLTTAKVGADTIQTRPLLPGKQVDLVGISQNPSMQATGQADNTDSLDVRLGVAAIYLKVETTAAVLADPNVISYIKVDTTNLPRNLFLKSQEGFDKEMVLNFINNTIPLSADTKDTSGAAASALYFLQSGPYADYVVRLQAVASGQANLETGNATFNAGTASINAMVVTNPADHNLDAPASQTDYDAIAAKFVGISIVGWDPLATRSNINRRTRGLQVTTVEQNERFTIPLGAPITCPNPVTNTRTATDMAAPITAARIRNDNNAVTKLLSYADTLASYKLSQSYLVPTPDLEGIGRLMIKPFYEEVTLDLLNVVSSLRSVQRADDVSAAIVNKIREMVYRAYRESGYQPALDAATGGTGEKPRLLIGTDPVLLRHIMVTGDTRTASIAFDHKIVSTYDRRMNNKIVMVFYRENLAGPDPLNFGNMLWMPELATNVQVTRNGAVVTETMVQPRTRHINTCPIMMVINVENLNLAIADQVPVNFHTV